jgi:hypothetical protein
MPTLLQSGHLCVSAVLRRGRHWSNCHRQLVALGAPRIHFRRSHDLLRTATDKEFFMRRSNVCANPPSDRDSGNLALSDGDRCLYPYSSPTIFPGAIATGKSLTASKPEKTCPPIIRYLSFFAGGRTNHSSSLVSEARSRALALQISHCHGRTLPKQLSSVSMEATDLPPSLESHTNRRRGSCATFNKQMS